MLKNKQADSIIECLKDLKQKEGDNLKSMSFDAGNGFDNEKVKKFFEDNNIKTIMFNKQETKNATSIIERFNRTIRDKITKY